MFDPAPAHALDQFQDLRSNLLVAALYFHYEGLRPESDISIADRLNNLMKEDIRRVLGNRKQKVIEFADLRLLLAATLDTASRFLAEGLTKEAPF